MDPITAIFFISMHSFAILGSSITFSSMFVSVISILSKISVNANSVASFFKGSIMGSKVNPVSSLYS